MGRAPAAGTVQVTAITPAAASDTVTMNVAVAPSSTRCDAGVSANGAPALIVALAEDAAAAT